MSLPIELRCFDLIRKRVKSEYALSMPTRGPEYYGSKFDVEKYTNAQTCAADYMLYSLLRKWEGWGSGKAAKDAAIATWKDCERKCFATNCRIRQFESVAKGDALTFILEVRRKISTVLGPLEESKLSSLCRWSGGATFRHRRGVASFEKQKLQYDVTKAAEGRARIGLWDNQTQEIFGTPDLSFEIVRGNRCVNVPKTAKTDRMIAAEPSANAFLQQGVGRYIRSRLKRVGIDLDSQEANQDAAFRAMVDGLATVDLSSASDTLSHAVVEMLLPREWYAYLNRLRSPFSLLDGTWVHLEKFSSMGNAFTFELESLIFWALAKSVVGDKGEVLVYGDDIIIPQTSYETFVTVLTFFGFEVNMEKSFSKGSFFESCGKHYFDLEEVTPPYQKRRCTTKSGKPILSEYIRFYNRLVRWGVRTGLIHLVKDALNLITKELEGIQGKKPIPRIPFSEQDTGILRPHSEFLLKAGQGDYLLFQLCPIPKVNGKEEALRSASRERDHKSQLGALSLKLRDPSYQNSGRDGQVEVSKDTQYILQRAVFWSAHLRGHASLAW